MITSYICKNAILESPEIIHSVPDKYKSVELVKISIEKGGSIEYCPIDMLNYDWCKIAININYKAIYSSIKNLLIKHLLILIFYNR
jgi:hypothetical protein